MRLLISMLMAFSIPLTSTAKDLKPGRDEVLWQTLVELNERGQEHKVVLGSYVAGGAIALVTFQKILRGQIISAALIGVASWYVYLCAYEWVSKQRRSHLKNRTNFYTEINDEIERERGHMWKLAKFLSRPLEDQYQRAAADPALREYLIQLNEWINEGALKGAPPLQPTQGFQP